MLATDLRRIKKSTLKKLDLCFELFNSSSIEMMMRTGMTRNQILIVLLEYYSLRYIANRTGETFEVMHYLLNY